MRNVKWSVCVSVTLKHKIVSRHYLGSKKVKCSICAILRCGNNCFLCWCTLKSQLVWREFLIENSRTTNVFDVLLPKWAVSLSLGISLQFRMPLGVYIWNTACDGKLSSRVIVCRSVPSVRTGVGHLFCSRKPC